MTEEEHNKDCRLRMVVPEDMMLLYQWRNDIDTRRNSFFMDEIPLENHKKWLQRTLQDESQKLWIMLVNSEPVGQVRVSVKEEKLEISYTIAPRFRGQGYGCIMLQLMENELINTEWGNRYCLYAEVKKHNIASQKIFLKLC